MGSLVAGDVKRRISGKVGPFASHTPSAVFREISAVIAAALGVTAGIDIVLLLLHVAPR